MRDLFSVDAASSFSQVFGDSSCYMTSRYHLTYDPLLSRMMTPQPAPFTDEIMLN